MARMINNHNKGILIQIDTALCSNVSDQIKSYALASYKYCPYHLMVGSSRSLNFRTKQRDRRVLKKRG
nr:hypothetical protein Itr_chr06CG10400 [Ipomoea trifida]